MSDDTKLDFYLRNRVDIEQWAALRSGAAQALTDALVERAHRLAATPDAPESVFKDSQAYEIGLTVTDSIRACLWWKNGDLLKGANGWPFLVIWQRPTDKQTRDALKAATLPFARPYGFTGTGSVKDWWVRSGKVPPLTEPININDYADHCLDRLYSLHRDLAAAAAAVASED